jgi:hypothetical protein
MASTPFSDKSTASTTAVSSSAVQPRPRVNPSDDVNNSVPGWPALARLISQHPELEAFPSFSDLALKSLLYYQAELIYLRKELHEAEYKDYRNMGISAHFAENLEYLFAARDEDAHTPKQWVIIEKIRHTLEKYRALFQPSIEGFYKKDG